MQDKKYKILERGNSMKFKSIGNNVKICKNARIIHSSNIEIGNNVVIDDFVFIVAKKGIKIGNNVHIKNFVGITGNGLFTMEDFTSISQGTKILMSSDDYTNSYLTNSTVPNEFKNVYSAPIMIKKFSVVGANCVILPGVTLREGTFIGPNSLVKANFVTEPYSLYEGTPIKKVGEMSDEKIRYLKSRCI